MIEGTPGKPYGGLLAHFNIVEANMHYRRQEAMKLLEPGEVVMSLTNFPRSVFFFIKKKLWSRLFLYHNNYRLGAPDFTDPPAVPNPQSGASRSLFFPDEAIFSGHPRFKTLTRNIRNRRGEKVAINLPSNHLFFLSLHLVYIF